MSSCKLPHLVKIASFQRRKRRGWCLRVRTHIQKMDSLVWLKKKTKQNHVVQIRVKQSQVGQNVWELLVPQECVEVSGEALAESWVGHYCVIRRFGWGKQPGRELLQRHQGGEVAGSIEDGEIQKVSAHFTLKCQSSCLKQLLRFGWVEPTDTRFGLGVEKIK